MRNILAILQREMKAYFVSPIAYGVLTVFALISGLLFYSILVQTMDQAMSAQAFGRTAQPFDVPGMTMQVYLGTLAVILLFVMPFTTMGLFAEEKRRGTIELLLTAPLRDVETVIGKFLAGLLFLVIMLAVSFLPAISLFLFSDPATGPIISGYLGLLLYGAALLGIGLFISSLTENQIVAAVLTFGRIEGGSRFNILADRVELELADLRTAELVDILGGRTSQYRELLVYLSVIEHLDDLIRGVIDTSHIIFYLSLLSLGLFLTYRSIESLRWRG